MPGGSKKKKNVGSTKQVWNPGFNLRIFNKYGQNIKLKEDSKEIMRCNMGQRGSSGRITILQ